MSTFRRITKHPETGEWKACWWLDDHFARHHCGVQFDGEEKVFDPEEIDLEVKAHEDLTEEELKAINSWMDELKDEPAQKKPAEETPSKRTIMAGDRLFRFMITNKAKLELYWNGEEIELNDLTHSELLDCLGGLYSEAKAEAVQEVLHELKHAPVGTLCRWADIQAYILKRFS